MKNVFFQLLLVALIGLVKARVKSFGREKSQERKNNYQTSEDETSDDSSDDSSSPNTPINNPAPIITVNDDICPCVANAPGYGTCDPPDQLFNCVLDFQTPLQVYGVTSNPSHTFGVTNTNSNVGVCLFLPYDITLGGSQTGALAFQLTDAQRVKCLDIIAAACEKGQDPTVVDPPPVADLLPDSITLASCPPERQTSVEGAPANALPNYCCPVGTRFVERALPDAVSAAGQSNVTCCDEADLDSNNHCCDLDGVLSLSATGGACTAVVQTPPPTTLAPTVGATCAVCSGLECLLHDPRNNACASTEPYCYTKVVDTTRGRQISRSCATAEQCSNIALNTTCLQVENKILDTNTACAYCCNTRNCNEAPYLMPKVGLITDHSTSS